MKQPVSGDDLVQYKTRTIQSNVEHEDRQEDQRLAPEELATLLGQLLARFAPLAGGDDLDMLGFSLHYLFYQIDTLYEVVLPALATFPSHTRLFPTDDLPYYHHNWHQLEQLRSTLERMEALVHLLNEAAASVLDRLDTTFYNSNTLHSTFHSPDAYQSRWLPTGEVRSWENAFAALSTRLHDWQQTHTRYRSLSTHFAHFLPTIPHIARMDPALDDFLHCVSAIYGNNLHALLNNAGPDEQTAPLLLDIMQEADLLLSSIDLLMEPLHGLMKNFALAAEMY